MVVTDDGAIHDRVVHLKGQGLARDREYWHDVAGYTYRMTNVCAAIGLAQFERADEILARKRDIAAWYAAGLRGASVTLQGEFGEVTSSHWT
jgi:perosamine synthetase